jgi:hypothetical protein
MGQLSFFTLAAATYVPPSTVYHHTTTAGLQGITQTGGISASSSGIGGAGKYLIGSPNAITATLQGLLGLGRLLR